MMPVEQRKKPVGATAATGTSAGIGGALVGICSILPVEYKDIGLVIIPMLSPALSLGGIYLYNKYIEDPMIVESKAKLDRDLTALKELCKDKLVNDETRAQARLQYSETKLMRANMGRAEILGKIKISSRSSTPESLPEIE